MDPKRLRDLFPGTYLTLVALVQSVALAILLTKWFDLILSLLDGQPSSTTPISTHVQFLACLMLIVVAWYEYYWAVWLLTWLPDIRDAVVPFALGTVEVMLIYSVRAPSRFPFFTFAGIVASFVSALAYYNSY